jgi:hypothetical protein
MPQWITSGTKWKEIKKIYYHFKIMQNKITSHVPNVTIFRLGICKEEKTTFTLNKVTE